MSSFENPQNEHREDVTGSSALWAFLFGWMYFAIKGLWRHVVIQIVIVSAAFVIAGPPGLLIAFLVWIGYAIATPSILRADYLRRGWREVAAGNAPVLAREDDHLRPPMRSRITAPESDRTAVPVPAPAAHQPSVADELAKLAALRDRGIISNAEFAAQKSLVLAPRRT